MIDYVSACDVLYKHNTYFNNHNKFQTSSSICLTDQSK